MKLIVKHEQKDLWFILISHRLALKKDEITIQLSSPAFKKINLLINSNPIE